MKVKQQSKGEQITVGIKKSVNATISTDKMHKMGEMLKNPYRNPIQSIVREITSNAFDSHREVGIQKPIKIKFSKDSSGAFISFQDFGTGMSPELVETIYSQYLQSTKEDTNDQLGYFGIGSKSPLSYTDHFHIITNYDGIEYYYIMRETDTLPQTNLFNEQPTEEENGTTIKIYFKADDDVITFVRAISNQLTYFKEVVVIDDLSEDLNSYYIGGVLLSAIKKFNDEFKIYNSDNFIYRHGNDFASDMHIVFDSVPYPINWSQLDLAPINIPIAIKMDIGEVMVTPNREDIRYTSDERKVIDGEVVVTDKGSKTILKEKIEAVLDELYELYNKQSFICDSIIRWKAMKDNNETLFINSEKGIEFSLNSLFKYDSEKYKAKEFTLKGLEGVKSLNSFITRLLSTVNLAYVYKRRRINGNINCEYITVSHHETITLNAFVNNNSYFVAQGVSLNKLERFELEHRSTTNTPPNIYVVNEPSIKSLIYALVRKHGVNISDVRNTLIAIKDLVDGLLGRLNYIDSPIEVSNEARSKYQQKKVSNRRERAEGQEKFSELMSNGRFSHSFEYFKDFSKRLKNPSNNIIIVGHINDIDRLKRFTNINRVSVVMVTNKKVLNRLIDLDRRVVHVDDVIGGKSRFVLNFIKNKFKLEIRNAYVESKNKIRNNIYADKLYKKFSIPSLSNDYMFGGINYMIQLHYSESDVNAIKDVVYKQYNFNADALNKFEKQHEILQYLEWNTPKTMVHKILNNFA